MICWETEITTLSVSARHSRARSRRCEGNSADPCDVLLLSSYDKRYGSVRGLQTDSAANDGEVWRAIGCARPRPIVLEGEWPRLGSSLSASKNTSGFTQMRSKHRSKRHDRFKGWRCDSCADMITSVQAGWVEWLASEDKHGNDTLTGLRLVHRGRQKNAGSHNCRYDPREEFRSGRTIVEGCFLNG